MNPLKTDGLRYYKRGDYGPMPAAPKIAQDHHDTIKEQHADVNTIAVAAVNVPDSSEKVSSEGFFNGRPIQRVENPHRATIHFVDSTLSHHSPPSKEKGWFPRIMQVVGDPLKPLALADNITPVPISDEEIEHFMNDPEIASFITNTSSTCAQAAMEAIQESAPPSFWGEHDHHEQLQHIKDRLFGFKATVPDVRHNGSFVEEKFPGIPEMNCRATARKAIKSVLEFVQKTSAVSPPRKALFNVNQVTKETAKAALKAYLENYTANFPSVAREYPELSFQAVSGVGFAPPTLETKVIFIEGDVDLLAKQKAQEAAIKTIAGFWEASAE